MKRWWIAVAYALFFLAMNWPVLPLVNTIEPRIAGTPFLIVWCLFWSFAIAIFHAIFLFREERDPVPTDAPEDEEVGA